MEKKHSEPAPLYSAKQKLPEITIKVIITSAILAILLAASNAYLALKVGTTVAASIPAAIISMGVFRFFRKTNILENNLVQTAASAGEALAGAASFILPALVILDYWKGFNFWETTILLLFGGLLGVFFSVPLRRALLNLKDLSFPEGTAIGNVLRARASGAANLKMLIQGGLAGAAVALCQTGFQFVSDHWPLWFKEKNTLFGISLGFDPVLLGAGYIIGINAGLTMFLGTFFAWILGVPILSHIYGIPQGSSTEDMVMSLWSNHIRYMGVGCMLIGGVWTVITLFKPMILGLQKSFIAMRKMKSGKSFIRTEKDIPLNIVLYAILFLSLFGLVILYHYIHRTHLQMSVGLTLAVTVLDLLYILIMGFISSLVCGYLVGLIGSTNTPISGILIINIIVFALLLLPILSFQINFADVLQQKAAIAVIIFTAAVVGFAAIITNENIQDLKAGRMVGATPWKQQLMMMFGVVVSATAIAPILDFLYRAYGMGGAFPHPGMDASQMLPAPQAGLMAALAQGVVMHNLPWDMLMPGAIIGVICVFIDEALKNKDLRLPVLAVGLGIYLPPEIITITFVGGLIHYFANRAREKRQRKTKQLPDQSAILLACGLVAGSSIMGVILAIPFVLKGNANVLKIVSDNFTPVANVIGFIITALLCIWLYRIAAYPNKK